MAEKTKLCNDIYRAVRSCYAMENTESWTTRALGHWNKAKKEANDNLEKLKAHVGILIKNINAEDSRRKAGLFKYFAKAAAKSSESSGANPNHSADDGGSDDIEITSSTAGPSAGPPTSTADQTSSSSQDKSESETSSLVVSKSTPAQDKVNASVDHPTKKIEWHKSSLESGIVEDASKTREKITSRRCVEKENSPPKRSRAKKK